jgi:hypothetical protein
MRLYVPEPVLDEFVKHHIEKVNGLKGKIYSIESEARQYIVEPPKQEKILPDIKFFTYEEIRARAIDSLKACSVEIVTTPPTDVKQFVQQCIREELPFEKDKKGRGFMDSVILHTVLSHALSGAKGTRVILSTDGVFADKGVIQRAKEKGVELVPVNGLPQAVLMLESFLSEDEQKRIEGQKALVLHFLETKKTDIAAFVKSNTDVDLSTILLFGSHAPLGSTAKGIQAVDIWKIMDVDVVVKAPVQWAVSFVADAIFMIDAETTSITSIPGNIQTTYVWPLMSMSTGPASFPVNQKVRVEATLAILDGVPGGLILEKAEQIGRDLGYTFQLP